MYPPPQQQRAITELINNHQFLGVFGFFYGEKGNLFSSWKKAEEVKTRKKRKTEEWLPDLIFLVNSARMNRCAITALDRYVI